MNDPVENLEHPTFFFLILMFDGVCILGLVILFKQLAKFIVLINN